jgi:F-type H+-transporting ATPase subunit b
MSRRTSRYLVPPLVIAAVLLLLPQVLLAAEESGGRWGVWLTIGRLFNLGLVIAVLVWALRKPLSAFFASRSQAIREQLEEAQKARAEAEAKLAEAGERMKRVEDELRDLKQTAEAEAQEEYGRLLAAAEKDADKIIERARQEIEGMTRAARMDLKAHAASLAVQMAEERIRSEMTPEDRERLFGNFVTELRKEK